MIYRFLKELNAGGNFGNNVNMDKKKMNLQFGRSLAMLYYALLCAVLISQMLKKHLYGC